VFWPTWSWIDNPAFKWLNVSYAQPLSIRDALKSRRVIESPWYQARWGHRYQLAGDQNQKSRYDNDKMGYRIATSVGGSATGEGGDGIVCDDAHNMNDAESEAVREGTLVWWDEVMSTRLNDPKRGSKVIIMQRAHERDLSGHVLQQGGYEHLMLPARYEPNRKCFTVIGFEDPRTEEHEPLWPAQFGHEELQELERAMGPYASAGQLQQRPAPREGGFFKRKWFEMEEMSPKKVRMRVRWWDMAATKKAGSNNPDYTAGVLLSIDYNNIVYVEDVINVRQTPSETEQLILATAQQDGKDVKIFMEQEPGSAGKIVISHMSRNVLIGYNFKGFPSTGSKEAYAGPLASYAQQGNLRLVRGAWNNMFLSQVEVFPNGDHDDMVDAASKGFARIAIRKKRAGTWGKR
jgi:predicted phage terminase large subunit-like protein